MKILQIPLQYESCILEITVVPPDYIFLVRIRPNISEILFKSSRNRFEYSSLRFTKKGKAALMVAFAFLIPGRLRRRNMVRTELRWKRSELMSKPVSRKCGSE